MRVGCFISEYPSNLYNEYGGGPRVARQIVENTSDPQIQFDIFTVNLPNSSNETTTNQGVHRYNSLFEISNTEISPKQLYKPLKYDLDIVHIHNTTLPGVLAGYIYSKFHNKPLIVTHHGDERFSNYGSLLRRTGVYFHNKILIKKVFEESDCVVISSSSYLDQSRLLDPDIHNIRTIPNGVNIGKYSLEISSSEARSKIGIKSADDIILFLGALNPKKGPDDLLRAFSKLEQNNVTLLIVGSGTLLPQLEQKAIELGVQNKVKFPGYVDEEVKPYYYAAADIFCLPSKIETEVFPLTLLEASAAGLPLVTSNLATFKNYVEDGINGKMYTKEDIHKLSNVLDALLTDEKKRECLGDIARQKAYDYRWENIADEYVELYKSFQ